jgi:hypothetical protein
MVKRGEPKEAVRLTPEEQARRLRRVKAMVDWGCDRAQVVERSGVTDETARRLVQQARSMRRAQAVG